MLGDNAHMDNGWTNQAIAKAYWACEDALLETKFGSSEAGCIQQAMKELELADKISERRTKGK